MAAEYYMSVALKKITESPDVARETVHLWGTSRNARFVGLKRPSLRTTTFCNSIKRNALTATRQRSVAAPHSSFLSARVPSAARK